jgi:hypothetical protein
MDVNILNESVYVRGKDIPQTTDHRFQGGKPDAAVGDFCPKPGDTRLKVEEAF